MHGDQLTPGKYTVKASEVLHGKKKKGLGIIDVLALTLSFAAGILIVTGILNLSAEPEQLARAVGEPAAASEASNEIGVEVAGVVCEAQQLEESANSSDALELWNAAVVATNDECTAPFGESLGSAWVMTDAELSVFGPVGSLYEFANTGGVLSGFRISLAAEDAASGEADVLVSLIESIWNAENIDWANGCDASSSLWSGQVSLDGFEIELARCR